MDSASKSRASFDEAFFRRNVPGTLERLRDSTVAILGAGGLGSHVAAALVRSGVGRLVVADPDRVELSNLNRQLFFHDQVGLLKVEALSATLKRIHPHVELTALPERIGPEGLIERMGHANLLVEALDRAEDKALLIETWLIERPDRYVVGASGLAGCGRTEELGIRRMGRLVLCGDGTRDMSTGLCAGRVGVVAHMEANVAVELLLTEDR